MFLIHNLNSPDVKHHIMELLSSSTIIVCMWEQGKKYPSFRVCNRVHYNFRYHPPSSSLSQEKHNSQKKEIRHLSL